MSATSGGYGRVSVRDLAAWKVAGQRWAMLTSYDALTAAVFDEAEIPVLLVGDSAANTVLGYPDTLAVTVDELLPLVRAVIRGTRRAMVVADLPFGSYQTSPQQALDTAVRFVKEGGAQAVKLEGGLGAAPAVEAIVAAGVPVMGHVGFTPQSVHAIGGYRVAGRGDDAARLRDDARAVAEAGAFAVVLEMVPAELAAQVTASLPVPTVGIGAGASCDAQVLVWTDMAGLTGGRLPRFVKRYAELRAALTEAAVAFRTEVAAGTYPTEEHAYH